MPPGEFQVIGPAEASRPRLGNSMDSTRPHWGPTCGVYVGAQASASTEGRLGNGASALQAVVKAQSPVVGPAASVDYIVGAVVLPVGDLNGATPGCPGSEAAASRGSGSPRGAVGVLREWKPVRDQAPWSLRGRCSWLLPFCRTNGCCGAVVMQAPDLQALSSRLPVSNLSTPLLRGPVSSPGAIHFYTQPVHPVP